LFEDLGLEVVLAADEDVRFADAARVAGDGDALEHQVGVKVHQQAVFEGTRLGLVGVDGEVALTAVLFLAGFVDLDLGEEGPLEAAGEASAAASAEGGFLDLVGDRVGLHPERFAEADIAAGVDVFVVGNDVTAFGIRVGPAGDPLGQNRAGEVGVDGSKGHRVAV